MVDYGKWDKYIAELSSDEEEDAKKRPGGVRVTTLPNQTSSVGSKVTIGPQGYQVHDESGHSNEPYGDGDDEEYYEGDYDEEEDEEVLKKTSLLTPSSVFSKATTTATAAGTVGSSSTASNMPISDRVEYLSETSQVTEEIVMKKKTENGQAGQYHDCAYYWSQSRHEVNLSIYLPPTHLASTYTPEVIKSISKRDLRLTYEEESKLLSVYFISKKVIWFQTNLQYAIELTGDPTNPYDDILEWAVVKESVADTSEVKLRVDLALKKHCPIANATLWLERVFPDETKIDVTKIAGRNLQSRTVHTDPFQQAHELFLQRMKEKEVIEIDIDDEEEEEENVGK